MNDHEQSNLDRVFGRIHIKTPSGQLKPLRPDIQPTQPPETQKAPAATPKHIEVARQVPKFEDSPMLRALKGTLPPPPDVTIKSKPAS